MNKDHSSTKPEQDKQADVATEQAPRKILQGKRVLRQFHIRSGMKTGSCPGDGNARSHTGAA